MSRLISLESRIRKIEKWQKDRGAGTYIFIIGPNGDFETEEEFDKEVKKTKYNNSKIIKIIDYWGQD